jgi:hypothetical protein
MTISLPSSLRILIAGAALPLALHSQVRNLPLKYSGPPTRAPITVGDLMTRLYKFADDSMMGRESIKHYYTLTTTYIEREVRRMGLKPGGENGSYFQTLPYAFRALNPGATITAGTRVYRAGTDFVATTAGVVRNLSAMTSIWGGTAFDTTNLLPADQIRGKVVIMRQSQGGMPAALVRSEGLQRYQAAMRGAVVMFVPPFDTLNTNVVDAAMNPANPTYLQPTEVPLSLAITAKMAEEILGAPLATLPKGKVGETIHSDIRFKDEPLSTARNVIAILEGSDPKLKGEFVALGARSDHVGFRAPSGPGGPPEHDSVRAFMSTVRPRGVDSPFGVQPTPDQRTRIRALTDSLRLAHGGPRLDSVGNGADDGGSGSVALLEIAEALTGAHAQPKRSILFVWHSAEEFGLLGSRLFTERQSVPRDSIVAQIELERIGRGGAADVTGLAADGTELRGGKGYLQLLGARRLSSEFGDLIETVNREEKLGFLFDYSLDAEGHPANTPCRSAYARWGIPVAFMTTGVHADYHMSTDEPQYIDYERLAAVTKLAHSLVLRTANLDHRLVIDKPKPDPTAACR